MPRQPTDVESAALRPSRRAAIALAVAAGVAGRASAAHAATAAELAQSSRTALHRLYALRPETRAWGKRAKAILVFPSIVKAGFVVGGQGGDGALLIGGKVQGFYRIAAASFGLQAGAQRLSYAMFFMTQTAVDYVKTSNGWALGSGPSVVAMDAGAAAAANTTTLSKDVYAVAYGQEGLMAGLDLEGSKISRIYPKA